MLRRVKSCSPLSGIWSQWGFGWLLLFPRHTSSCGAKHISFFDCPSTYPFSPFNHPSIHLVYFFIPLPIKWPDSSPNIYPTNQIFFSLIHPFNHPFILPSNNSQSCSLARKFSGCPITFGSADWSRSWRRRYKSNSPTNSSTDWPEKPASVNGKRHRLTKDRRWWQWHFHLSMFS